MRFDSHNPWIAPPMLSWERAIMARQLSALHVAFGAEVRAVRVERGLSQLDLARLSGLHRAYIGGIERGERNPSLTNIGRLADALGVSAMRLLTRTGRA
jgi:DNA-binding XRE family transcriptional regulator